MVNVVGNLPLQNPAAGSTGNGPEGGDPDHPPSDHGGDDDHNNGPNNNNNDQHPGGGDDDDDGNGGGDDDDEDDDDNDDNDVPGADGQQQPAGRGSSRATSAPAVTELTSVFKQLADVLSKNKSSSESSSLKGAQLRAPDVFAGVDRLKLRPFLAQNTLGVPRGSSQAQQQLEKGYLCMLIPIRFGIHVVSEPSRARCRASMVQ